MNDLLIVFIGLAIMFYIFFVLGTSRTAIKKGLNGSLWFLFSITLPPVAYTLVLLATPKQAKTKEEYDFAEKNGGVLWVESEEGKGSRFSITVQRYLGAG